MLEVINVINIPFADNKEARVAVVLVLDISYSMVGEKLKKLIEGVKLFIDSIKNDPQAYLSLELSIIVYNNEVEVLNDFCNVDDIKIEELEELQARGGTNTGAALIKAVDLLNQRKKDYKNNSISYYRPWLMCLTDGNATYSIDDAVDLIREEERKNSINTYMIGIGQDIDMNTLSKLTTTDVFRLNDLAFEDLFCWLSNSIIQVSVSEVGETLTLPAATWGTVE
jgi:uncharacterized protein YegL